MVVLSMSHAFACSNDSKACGISSVGVRVARMWHYNQASMSESHYKPFYSLDAPRHDEKRVSLCCSAKQQSPGLEQERVAVHVAC